MPCPDSSRPARSAGLRRLGLAAALSLALGAGANAQSSISDASALSALPIAVSVAAPVAILSAGAALSVVTVEATSTGAVWVLERASDGTRADPPSSRPRPHQCVGGGRHTRRRHDDQHRLRAVGSRRGDRLRFR